METFSALLALSAGNSSATGEIPSQRPVTRSFDVFFDLRLDKRLSKQWRRWWFDTPSFLLWRHCNGLDTSQVPLLYIYVNKTHLSLYSDVSYKFVAHKGSVSKLTYLNLRIPLGSNGANIFLLTKCRHQRWLNRLPQDLTIIPMVKNEADLINLQAFP